MKEASLVWPVLRAKRVVSGATVRQTGYGDAREGGAVICSIRRAINHNII